MRDIKLLFAITMILEGCLLNKNASEISFVHKYGKEDFSIFKNTSFTLRGLDNEGNKIIFAYDISLCGYLKVVLENDSLTVINTEPTPLKEGCLISRDTTKIRLSKTFAKYNINYLTVNNYNNAFLKTKPFEGKPNLMLLNDSTNIGVLNLEEWERLEGNWYILRDK